MDRKRVYAARRHLVRQQRVDPAVPLQPRLANECIRDDNDPEMALTSAWRRPMPGMHSALVNDIETARLKSSLEFLAYLVFDHDTG